MKNEYKRIAMIIVVAVVIVAAAAIFLSTDDRDNGYEVPKHTDRYPVTVSVESFELNSEKYGIWMTGTVTVYRSGDGFEGNITPQYYYDPEDPNYIQVYLGSEFVMTKLGTDHQHQCLNTMIISWNPTDPDHVGSGLWIDHSECPYRDDGGCRGTF